MTSVAWAIMTSALLAADAWYMHTKTGDAKYYDGIPIMAGLLIFSFIALVVCTVVELRR